MDQWHQFQFIVFTSVIAALMIIGLIEDHDETDKLPMHYPEWWTVDRDIDFGVDTPTQ